MAVIVRKKVKIADKDVEMRTYLPPGGLSKEERLRADRLDETLSRKMPIIAKEISEMPPEEDNLVFKRYKIGCYMREIIDDPELVSRTDVENKMVFLAIWDHLPLSLKPEGPTNAKPYSERQLRRKGYLSLCYEISQFDWSDVKWIKRWDDWYRLAFRPGIVRDKRILKALGKAISELGTYPSARGFREIAKLLGRAFPTRRLRDSSLFTDEKITQVVHETLQQVNRNLTEKHKTTMRK